MIVFTVLGTSADSTEGQLQVITNDLIALCRNVGGRPKAYGSTPAYVAFPIDRMQIDIGIEIVVQIAADYLHPRSFTNEVKNILLRHFPEGTKIGIQVILARLRESI